MVGARHRGVSNLVNDSGVLVRSRVHSEVDVLCHRTGKFSRGKNLTIPGGGVDSGGLIGCGQGSMESCELHSCHQMRGSGILEWGETGEYGGVLVRNRLRNLYLDMEVAIESEVADTEGSTATPPPP